MELHVAGAQIPVTRDVQANLRALHRALDFAIGEGADVLLTPEGSLSGYTPDIERDRVTAALEEITARARAARVGLALGTCFIEPTDGCCYNQIRFYDPQGRFLGFHAKTLRCGSMTDPPEGEINHYAAAPLRTFGLNGIAVGGLICNDLWANPGCTPMPDPHLTQQLAEMGARIIFHAVNGGRDGSEWSRVNWAFHESNLRMRARAGEVWIVTVDNCHPPGMPCSAPSGIVRPDGTWALKMKPRGEQMFAYTIQMGR